MTNFGRLCAFFIALMLSFQSWGAVLYEQTFEGATPLGSRSGIDLERASCFNEAEDGFNSVELSTTHARSGTQSVRYQTPGNIKCDGNSRNEIKFGVGLPGLVPGVDTVQGVEYWIGFSIYFPSNEGTDWWNTGATDFYIFQGLGKSLTDGGSPEFNMIKKTGASIATRIDYSTDATREILQHTSTYEKPLMLRDSWNDVVIHWKRTYQNTGRAEVWINGTKMMDYTGPAAIRIFDRLWLKIGTYFTSKIVPHVYVQYVDNVKIGDLNSSFAEVDPSVGSEYTCPGDPRCAPVTDSITSVNGDTAVPANTLTSAVFDTNKSVLGCKIGLLPESYANWNYTDNATAKFNSGNVTSLTSAAQNIECYLQEHMLPISMDNALWTPATNTTDNESYSDTRYGYTTGMQVKRTGSSTYTETRLSIENLVTNVIGDRQEFEFTYSCLPGSCDNLYFALENESIGSPNYPRLTLEGTAGALGTLSGSTYIPGTLNGGFGSSASILNRTLGENVYRATLRFTATVATTKYKLRVGTRDGTLNQIVTVHEIIPRKNPVTTTISKSITIVTTDVTAPTLSNCAMTNVKDPLTGFYNTSISCETDESGGTVYALIKDTNTPPADAAELEAGTGAIWSSNKSVDNSTLDFEFTLGSLGYQDLWAWVVQKDMSANRSDVISLSFDSQNKSFVWSNAAGNAIHCYNANTNTLTPFTGNMAITITTGDWFAVGDDVTELAYAPVVAFVNGEAELVEDDLTFGSVNALLTGAQGYNYWATDGGTCRADNAIQLTVE